MGDKKKPKAMLHKCDFSNDAERQKVSEDIAFAFVQYITGKSMKDIINGDLLNVISFHVEGSAIIAYDHDGNVVGRARFKRLTQEQAEQLEAQVEAAAELENAKEAVAEVKAESQAIADEVDAASQAVAEARAEAERKQAIIDHFKEQDQADIERIEAELNKPPLKADPPTFH